MDLGRVDLNQLVHLDVLLRELSVTNAAIRLGITQPAMSNSLKRLRLLFEDPLLVRTSEGMVATELAFQLKPKVRTILSMVEQVVQPDKRFDLNGSWVFRIMVSDYAESTLMPEVLNKVCDLAPNVTFDMLTPSDVSFEDVEQGRVDMVINRFDEIPNSFHQTTLWHDGFSCLMNRNNPIVKLINADPGLFTLEHYLKANHIWVSKTGYGIGHGVSPSDTQRLGWVDNALHKLGKRRRIRVFTRHYQVAMLLAQQQDLMVTLPTRLAQLQQRQSEMVLLAPPFEIDSFRLKMAWSPLLHHNSGHRWLRQLMVEVARNLSDAKLQLPI